MVLLPNGTIETSYNRQGGTNTTLTQAQAFSRVCQYHKKPGCINPNKSGPLETFPAELDLPTTEGWMERATNMKKDIQNKNDANA